MATPLSGNLIGLPMVGGGRLYFREDRWIFISDDTATIGTHVEDGSLVKLGDEERCGGHPFY
jgi:hypothetical protein